MRYLWLVVAGLLVGWTMGWVECSHFDTALSVTGAYLGESQRHLRVIAGQLREYHKATGTYPTNERGLHPVEKPLKDYMAARDQHSRTLLRVLPSGPVSLWGEPFIYENRRGLPASAFAGSGATIDTDRAYSIKVDDGIYVWSVGAQQKYLEYRHQLMARNWVDVAYRGAWAIALFCVVMFVRSCLRSSLEEPADGGSLLLVQLIAGTIVVALTGLFGQSRWQFETCYLWGISAMDRDPALEQRYKAVMQKYSEHGVISKEALKKLDHALEEDKSSPRYWR